VIRFLEALKTYVRKQKQSRSDTGYEQDYLDAYERMLGECQRNDNIIRIATELTKRLEQNGVMSDSDLADATRLEH
jgi:hypothetical protein